MSEKRRKKEGKGKKKKVSSFSPPVTRKEIEEREKRSDDQTTKKDVEVERERVVKEFLDTEKSYLTDLFITVEVKKKLLLSSKLILTYRCL